MNLHIFHNITFLDFAKQEFELTNEDEKFVIITDQEDEIDDKEFFSQLSLREFIKINNPQRIIIHYLDGVKAKPIIDSEYKGYIHWSAWGADIYSPHFGFSKKSLYLKKTKKIYHKLKIRSQENIVYRSLKLFRPILGFAFKLRYNHLHNYYYVEQLLSKVNSFSTVVPTEKDIIQRRVNGNYKAFTYGNIKTLVPEKLRKMKDIELGDRILVGGSATLSQNHLDIFEITGYEINAVIPINYGEEMYKQYLIDKLSGYKNFILLTERLSYESYIELLMSCGCLIMNQLRQQSVGSIVLGLFLGMRVYLNASNPVYKFLVSENFIVFDLQKDFSNYGCSPLTKMEIEKNRKCLSDYWGEESSEKRMRNFWD
ncbi:TDP-N-acetylfucosamine:lipid II N-acetylfucosaminyltransferase [Paracrocinitomix mangrovi]|uniref:TDP-N-acetylfucosamine:lipid II N-acetylfucosaminyltransferase n=1 Tax=Paracrocinitomix mangrovi TaxID=2862509 RepID=UPI001C8DE18B|nr:TDP-N-acetylfucosamine:lipid II N-acetylfucosaminyltransferase [Paracrocinitomix mangrovi]UKN01241.1 TDP-N-acetylfucosamine:lipid II N-acetylfucosaminyltransferase [Paracrocinitomix mangrovi]